jgi:hypothetical protein
MINGSDGTVIWGKQIGGTGDQTCESATIDNNGDVIIAGNYGGTLDFGGGALPPVSPVTRTSLLPSWAEQTDTT